MTQSRRKLIGTVLVLVSIVVYSGLVVALYLTALQGAAWWVLILFFAATGMLWFFPATMIIRWMARPDAQ
jgi:hypothetical protein